MSPALAGRLLTTAPPGKSQVASFYISFPSLQKCHLVNSFKIFTRNNNNKLFLKLLKNLCDLHFNALRYIFKEGLNLVHVKSEERRTHELSEFGGNVRLRGRF